MTTYEFDVQYARLEKSRPKFYQKIARKLSVQKAVMKMETQEFKKLVDFVVQNPALKIDVEEALRNLKISERRIQDTRQYLAECENRNEATTAGLNNLLNEYGASSAVELIGKIPNSNGGECEN